MREQRWKRLRTGLLIIAFSAIGMLEYVQLVQAFDLPQMMLVVPVVSVIYLENTVFLCRSARLYLRVHIRFWREVKMR